MLSRLETRYEKDADYSSKKYGNGPEKISMQDSSSSPQLRSLPSTLSLFDYCFNPEKQ
jgi:hypothetical protein